MQMVECVLMIILYFIRCRKAAIKVFLLLLPKGSLESTYTSKVCFQDRWKYYLQCCWKKIGLNITLMPLCQANRKKVIFSIWFKETAAFLIQIVFKNSFTSYVMFQDGASIKGKSLFAPLIHFIFSNHYFPIRISN